MDFSQQVNVKTFLDPFTISDFFDVCDDTFYVKQHSDVWHWICELCAVTGSTLHNAIGLGTLQQQKDHYDYKFNKKEIPATPVHVQEMMDYVSENEVNKL